MRLRVGIAAREWLGYARAMARKSPRSRKKSADAPKLPASPRVRSAPGQSRTRESRASHALQGARPTPASQSAARKQASRATPKPRRAVVPKLKKTQMPDGRRVKAILEQLHELYPDAKCALDFQTPLQLLIATILSAQCTDERVNLTTPALFASFPNAQAFADASMPELEKLIHSTGFFRQKAKSIQQACSDIIALHAGEVPRTLEELTALRGVGRKTANVVLGNAFGITAGIVVDTHVTRLSNRLGFTTEQDAVKIEFALMPIVPKESWTLVSHWLILHGRAVCNARKPHCSVCPLSPLCPKLGVTVAQ